MSIYLSKTLKILLCLAMMMVFITGSAVAWDKESQSYDVAATQSQETPAWVKSNMEYQFYETFLLFPPWLPWSPPWVKPVKNSFTRFWWARPMPVPPPKAKPPASPTVASPPVFKVSKNNYGKNFGF